MSKKQDTRSDRPFDELSLDSLDVVVGGNAGAPMGLGSALAAQHPLAASSSALPGHFGLNMGGASSVHATSALPAAASPGPMGLGGNMPGMLPTHEPVTASSSSDNGVYSNANPSGQTPDHTTDPHATTGHAGETLGVNAGSAFQLLDEAAQDAAPHAATPQGLGGNGN